MRSRERANASKRKTQMASARIRAMEEANTVTTEREDAEARDRAESKIMEE